MPKLDSSYKSKGPFGEDAVPMPTGGSASTSFVPITREDENRELKNRVNARLEKIRKRWSEKMESRRDSRDAALFLSRDQRLWLQKNPDESDSHWFKKVHLAIDLCNLVLRETAAMYVSPPRRSAVLPAVPSVEEYGLELGSDAIIQKSAELALARTERNKIIQNLNTLFRSKIWESGEYGLDLVFADIDRWVLYHGTVAVEPRYWSNATADGVEPLYYRRHEFEVLPNPNDPRQAEAVVLIIGEDDEENDGGLDFLTGSNSIKHYWDGEVFCRLKGWQIDDCAGMASPDPRWAEGIFIHGMGEMPIQFAKADRTQRKFYASPSWVNLKPQCEVVSKLWTEYVHILTKQHGYAYTDGPLGSKTLAVDGLIEGTEPGQQFKIEAPKADLANMLGGIQRIMDMICVTMGLSPGALALDPQSSRSGVAIVAQQRAIETHRVRRIPDWRAFEKNYHKAAVRMYDVMKGQPLVPIEVPINLTFRAPETHISRQDRRLELSDLRKEGLISRERMLQMLMPELTGEEVSEWIQEHDEEKTRENEKAVVEQPITGSAGSIASQFLKRAVRDEPA